jgi:hypothetical protein
MSDCLSPPAPLRTICGISPVSLPCVFVSQEEALLRPTFLLSRFWRAGLSVALNFNPSLHSGAAPNPRVAEAPRSRHGAGVGIAFSTSM